MQERTEAQEVVEDAFGGEVCDLLCGGAGCFEHHEDEEFWDGFYEEEEREVGCVLGDECIVADPVHLSSECHTADWYAEEYHRHEWLRSEVLEHGAGPDVALVLERALVGILASARVAGGRVMAAEDCGPYGRLLFESWPGIARAALEHKDSSGAQEIDEKDADPRLLERMMDLREALHWAEEYGRHPARPDHEALHGVCVEIPDFVGRALEGGRRTLRRWIGSRRTISTCRSERRVGNRKVLAREPARRGAPSRSRPATRPWRPKREEAPLPKTDPTATLEHAEPLLLDEAAEALSVETDGLLSAVDLRECLEFEPHDQAREKVAEVLERDPRTPIRSLRAC